MVDMDTHEFNILNTGKIKPEKLSTNAHVEEIHETEQVHVSAKLLCLFLKVNAKRQIKIML